MEIPLVSVVVTAFNQENYISKTIESIISQKTSFQFEVVIGEDLSTDRTKEILQQFSKKYPHIRVIFNEKNLGIVGNWNSTILKSYGKYIALCEGDDYWTDVFKLQKQVDFLEKNPEYGMVCTDYEKFFEDNGSIKTHCFKFKHYEKGVKFNDYIHDRGTIMSASAMFRKRIFDDYHKEIPANLRMEWKMPDSPLWLYIAYHSKIGVLPDSTAVYTIRKVSGCRMPDAYQQFRFVEKGYEIPLFFAEKYKVAQGLIRTIKTNRLNFVLEYAFRQKDKNLFKEGQAKYCREIHGINPRVWLFKFAFIHPFFHAIVKTSIDFWRKIILKTR